MSYSRHAWIALLRQHSIAPTHQRLEIPNVLFSRGEHRAADQILALVNERHAATSKATVYNTLNLFREVIVDPKRVFYDPNTQPHHHLCNVDTGAITDIPADDLAVSGMPELPLGMVTEGVDIVVRIRAL